MFEWQLTTKEEKTMVLFKGDMDIEITEVLEEEIMPALAECTHVDMNFSEVPFVDSTGIGLLMNLVQQLQEQRVKVTISEMAPQVYEIFNLLQIPDILGRDIFIDYSK